MMTRAEQNVRRAQNDHIIVQKLKELRGSHFAGVVLCIVPCDKYMIELKLIGEYDGKNYKNKAKVVTNRNDPFKFKLDRKKVRKTEIRQRKWQ